MKKICLTGILFFLLLSGLTGCTDTVPAARRETLPSFSEQTVLDSMERAIQRGNTELTMQYTYEPGLEDQISETITEHFQDRYLLQCLLKDVSIDFSRDKDVLTADYKMIYSETVSGCGAVYTVRDEDELEDLFKENCLNHRPKTAALIETGTFPEEKIFGCLNSAEVNTSLMPYEATELTYAVYPPGDGQTLVLAWAKFPADEETLQARQDELYQAVIEAASDISQQENGLGLYKRIYNYILEHAEYDDAISEATLMGGEYVTHDMHRQRSAYGALIEGRTVCTGYARAFQALCDQLGLPCYTVLGSYNGTGHAWNAVYIDGETRYVDCTLADTGTPEADAFLINEEQKNSLGYAADEFCRIPW